MFPEPLRAFQQVVRSGSIRKASEQMSVAPSSVSRQVAVLERLIGTPLFRRSVTGITLTYAGQLVAQYADNVIGGFDALRVDLNDLRGDSRQINVAMVESITALGPTRAMMAFNRRFPNVTFNFRIFPAPAVVDALLEQQCDIGIGYNTQLDPMIVRVAQISEPVVAVVPIGHAFAGRDAIGVGDLVGEAVALPHRDFGIRLMFERICADAQVQVTPVLQTNSFEALRDFARSQAGIAVLPLRAAWRETLAGRVVVVPLDHAPFRDSTLDVMLPKQLRIPRITQLFADSLADHFAIEEDPPASTGAAASRTP